MSDGWWNWRVVAVHGGREKGMEREPVGKMENWRWEEGHGGYREGRKRHRPYIPNEREEKVKQTNIVVRMCTYTIYSLRNDNAHRHKYLCRHMDFQYKGGTCEGTGPILWPFTVRILCV